MSEAKLQGEYRSVGLFIENSRTYIQLSTGALLTWLAAIISGATYQYCAAKYLESLEVEFGTLHYDRARPFPILQRWIDAPYKLYGTLMIFFYGGTGWFALSAAYQIAFRQ